MYYLLINYQTQFLPYLDKMPNLDKYSTFYSNKNVIQGIIFITENDIVKELDTISKGINRLIHLNNNYNNIKSVCYLNYQKGKICELYPCNSKYIKTIIQCCNHELDSKCILWVCLHNINNVDDYLMEGFLNPSIVNVTPLNNNIQVECLSLTRENKEIPTGISQNKEISKETLGNIDICKKEIKYALQQYKTSPNFHFDNTCSCQMKCTISRDTLNYIRNLVTEKPKEIGGNLILSNTKGNIYEFSLENNTVIEGKNEDIESIESLYSFHTHPYQAYVRNNVTKAWASSDDYLAFLELVLDKNSIFHVVSTIEGIYILTLNKYWTNHKKELKEIPEKKLEKMYNISHKAKYTPKQYVEFINNFTYNNLPGIFHIYFFSWEEMENYPQDFVFNVDFSKESGNCFISNKNIDNFRLLYKKK